MRTCSPGFFYDLDSDVYQICGRLECFIGLCPEGEDDPSTRALHRSLPDRQKEARRCLIGSSVNASLCLHTNFSKTISDDLRAPRSSKVPFAGLGAILIVPGGFALCTTPSSIVEDLIQHQFMLSSVTLSWMSASVLLFYMMHFNTSFSGVAGSLVGLLGPSLSLISRDYSSSYGYSCLLGSYGIFALINNPYRFAFFGRKAFKLFSANHGRIGKLALPLKSSGRATLPVCVAKPIAWMSWMNIVLLIATFIRKSYVEKELATTSYEAVIRRYEAEHGITGERKARLPNNSGQE